MTTAKGGGFLNFSKKVNDVAPAGYFVMLTSVSSK
jgi:hypothetical protein